MRASQVHLDSQKKINLYNKMILFFGGAAIKSRTARGIKVNPIIDKLNEMKKKNWRRRQKVHNMFLRT